VATIGQNISHYRILEKLGEGGMGVVYKAEDTKLRRIVALKFLPPELTRDGAAKERFINEARAASSLDHPNICSIHEIGETQEGQTFIVMAYYEGESLERMIARGPLPLDEALDIAVQTAQGLAKAHGRGIVHRDIKPANILITTDGLVKIVDFGLAKLAGAKLTRTGATLGTAQYMSPEQARGEQVDARSDIFSLGAVLYEMLTGKHAFPGEYEQATIYAILNEMPAPVTSLRSGVPMELERIIEKALAKKSSERYQHVDDLIVDLKECTKEAASVGRNDTAVSLRGKARPWLRFWIPAAIILAAIALVVLFNPFNFRIGPRKMVADRKSVAVLPFANLSGDKADDYFSDGMTEDIIAQLSNIAELKVVSRTSIMRYKNTNKSLRDIAKELDVAAVLEGSVRRANNQVRIVAQLIDATSDKHIWARTYDKEITQIFAIQSDVAEQIAAALKAKLSSGEKERIQKKPTESLEAYSYYLKGRDYYYHYRKADNEQAIELFKRALEIDPRYALAYAGLGDAYEQRVIRFGFPDAWSDSSISMSGKAIALDTNLAEGYKALGLAYTGKGWMRRGLEANLRAAELNPNHEQTISNIGWNYFSTGAYDEAYRWQKKALALQPAGALTMCGIGEVYLGLGDDRKAEEWFGKALHIQPDLMEGQLGLAEVYVARGEYERSIEQARKYLSLDPNDISSLGLAGYAELVLGNYALAEDYFGKTIAIDSVYGATGALGYVYWKTGRKDEAQRMFARSSKRDEDELARGAESYEMPLELAEIDAVQGNKEESYYWLQKAVDAGWRDYRDAAINPLLENLRNDARFERMMAGVKAKVDEMKKRIEEMDKQ